MNNTVKLHIQRRWYDLIPHGEKSYEGRLDHGDVKPINTGTIIIFYTEDLPELKVKVVSKHHFSSFADMFQNIAINKLLPGLTSVEEGIELYRSFPGYREGEMTYGVVVFGIELVQ